MSLGSPQESRSDQVAFWLAQAQVERRRPQVRTRSLDTAIPPSVLALIALAAGWLVGGAL